MTDIKNILQGMVAAATTELPPEWQTLLNQLSHEVYHLLHDLLLNNISALKDVDGELPHLKIQAGRWPDSETMMAAAFLQIHNPLHALLKADESGENTLRNPMVDPTWTILGIKGERSLKDHHPKQSSHKLEPTAEQRFETLYATQPHALPGFVCAMRSILSALSSMGYAGFYDDSYTLTLEGETESVTVDNKPVSVPNVGRWYFYNPQAHYPYIDVMYLDYWLWKRYNAVQGASILSKMKTP